MGGGAEGEGEAWKIDLCSKYSDEEGRFVDKYTVAKKCKFVTVGQRSTVSINKSTRFDPLSDP